MRGSCCMMDPPAARAELGGLCARSPLRKPAHADERTARKSGASPGLRLKAWRDRCERGRHALGTHRSPPPVVSRGGTAIIDAVHAALMAAFRIPAKDKHVRLQVHEPHRLRTRRRWPNLSTRRWCRWAALPVAPSKPSDGSTGRSSTALNRWESLATMSRSLFAEALPKTGVSGVARLRVTSTSGSTSRSGQRTRLCCLARGNHPREAVWASEPG